MKTLKHTSMRTCAGGKGNGKDQEHVTLATLDH